MTSFFDTAYDTHGKKAPQAVPTSGNKEDIQNFIIKKFIDSGDRVYDNISFKAKVLYSSILTESQFASKVPPDIARFVLGDLQRTGQFVGPLPPGQSIPPLVIQELIVYIPELCICLPRPPDSKARAFFDNLNKISAKASASQKEEFDKLSKKTANKKESADSIAYLEMIKRFPRAYYAKNTKTAEDFYGSGNTLVKVKFMYDYDISVGAVTNILER